MGLLHFLGSVQNRKTGRNTVVAVGSGVAVGGGLGGDSDIIDTQSTVVVGVTCGDSGTQSGVTGDGDSSGILGPVVIA